MVIQRFAGTVAVLAAALSVAFAGGGKFIPPDGKVLVFAGQNVLSVDEYAASAGRPPAGVMVYTSVQQADALYGPADHGAGVNDGSYLLERYPDAVVQIGLYMVGVLDDVAAGRYDENLDRIGEWMRAAARPVYLRIGYEFDGPHNRYDPEKYVQAYRYVVDRFRERGIDNIAYVWHSSSCSLARSPAEWYPGDEYVDWFGISYFAQPERYMRPMVDLAKERRKPLMIAESAPAGVDPAAGDKTWEWWYRRYFEFIERNDVRALSYINCDWDALPLFAHMHWKDSRIDANELIRRRWVDETGKEKYLHSSNDLFGLLGYVPGG